MQDYVKKGRGPIVKMLDIMGGGCGFYDETTNNLSHKSFIP
jgi:hypothetical protein